MITIRHQWLLAALLILTPVISPMFSPETAWSGDICEIHMDITDELFSVFGDNGVPVQLNDIGCAAVMRELMCAMEQIAFDGSAIVKDYLSGQKTSMSTAYFVLDSGVATPLGTKVIAFASKQDAEKFIAGSGKGKILDYSDLMAHKVEFTVGAKTDTETKPANSN